MKTFSAYAQSHNVDISAAAVRREYTKRRSLAHRPQLRIFPGVNNAARALTESGSIRSSAAAQHEKIYLAQHVSATELARAYCTMFEKLNHFSHAVIMFPASCDMGEDDNDTGHWHINADQYAAA